MKVRTAPPAVGIVEGNGLRRGHRNEGDRRNRADVKPAKVVFATHVEAAEGRYFLAAKSGGVCGGEMQAQDVALLRNIGRNCVYENTLVMVFTLPPSGPPEIAKE